jgi:hypothetical protein
MFYEVSDGRLVKIDFEKIDAIICESHDGKYLINFWPIVMGGVNDIKFPNQQERDDCYQKILAYIKTQSMLL